jgi:hypothetical protein
MCGLLRGTHLRTPAIIYRKWLIPLAKGLADLVAMCSRKICLAYCERWNISALGLA